MKKLGFGLMRLPLTNPDDATSIDINQLNQMVDEFIARGFTYFDTAWMYCGFKSEDAVKEALVSRHPRDSFALADKLHAAFLETPQDPERIFSEQLGKTGAEFFDYYLIHDVRKEHYEIFNRFDCFNWIKDKKAKGLVKKIGFSFHDDAEFLDKVLCEHPEMDFVQLQINYLDWESERVQSRLCYETARRHGKDIVVMEPVKGGALANVPDAVRNMFLSHSPEMSVPSWAIRFAAGLPGVFMVLSGMSNMEQLCDNTDYMRDFVPLDEEEQRLVHLAADIINKNIAIPCTGCSYCTEGCPQNIAIPKYFTLYNADRKASTEAAAQVSRGEYAALSSVFGRAGDCIGCGRCESVCPQQLKIVDSLKTVSEYYECESAAVNKNV